MSEDGLHPSAQDAAWASIITPLTIEQLDLFCTDIERLFRVNPFIEIDHWHQLDPHRYEVSGRNFSQDPAFDFSFEMTVHKQANEIRIDYSEGLKSSTRFSMENDEAGSKLTITEDYSSHSEEERRQRLGEVDKSLVKWAGDLRAYIVMWNRWSWLAPWRWYMRHVWQPMKPSARRIVYMLIWISAAEAALIALGFAIYWLEFS